MTVILVEGESDRIALEVIAARMGARLPRILVIGGATGAQRTVATLDGENVLGLVDVGERRHFERAMSRVFVCDPDLEGELIRALGVEGVEAVIGAEGELESFRRLQTQPAQRGKRVPEQLMRFFGGRSGNKARYAGLLAGAVALDQVPAPIAALIGAAAIDRAAPPLTGCT